MFNWLTQNWSFILSGCFAFITVASIVVKFTPNTKDDEFANKIVEFLDHFSVAKTEKDKKMIRIAQDVLGSRKKEE